MSRVCSPCRGAGLGRRRRELVGPVAVALHEERIPSGLEDHAHEVVGLQVGIVEQVLGRQDHRRGNVHRLQTLHDLVGVVLRRPRADEVVELVVMRVPVGERREAGIDPPLRAPTTSASADHSASSRTVITHHWSSPAHGYTPHGAPSGLRFPCASTEPGTRLSWRMSSAEVVDRPRRPARRGCGGDPRRRRTPTPRARRAAPRTGRGRRSGSRRSRGRCRDSARATSARRRSARACRSRATNPTVLGRRTIGC